MTASTPPHRSETTRAVFSHAVAHCLVAFPFRDAPRCSAVMLWSVLVWAASRTKSLYHAAQRLYPGTQDQTFWNRLRANLPKQVPALERRLNELLRVPNFLPWLAGRLFPIAIDYHAIPYYGLPKKVVANCDAAGPNAARPSSTPTPRPVWSPPGGVTPWRSRG
jgi:hypothetical protein